MRLLPQQIGGSNFTESLGLGDEQTAFRPEIILDLNEKVS